MRPVLSAISLGSAAIVLLAVSGCGGPEPEVADESNLTAAGSCTGAALDDQGVCRNKGKFAAASCCACPELGPIAWSTSVADAAGLTGEAPIVHVDKQGIPHVVYGEY